MVMAPPILLVVVLIANMADQVMTRSTLRYRDNSYPWQQQSRDIIQPWRLPEKLRDAMLSHDRVYKDGIASRWNRFPFIALKGNDPVHTNDEEVKVVKHT